MNVQTAAYVYASPADRALEDRLEWQHEAYCEGWAHLLSQDPTLIEVDKHEPN